MPSNSYWLVIAINADEFWVDELVALDCTELKLDELDFELEELELELDFDELFELEMLELTELDFEEEEITTEFCELDCTTIKELDDVVVIELLDLLLELLDKELLIELDI